MLGYLLSDVETHLNNEYSSFNIQQEIIIEQFFANHSCLNVSINDLARKLHLSLRQVNRILHNLYSCSFTRKLTEIRLEKIKLAITQSGAQITDAALSNGFHTLPYFFTVFHESCGCSPSQYVRQYRREITSNQAKRVRAMKKQQSFTDLE